MKYSLPNLTLGRILLASVLLAAAPGASRAADMKGQELVAEAASRLALQPAVSAKIRQRAVLFGQELVGSGSYQQVLSEGRTRIRLEMKLQVDDRLTTLLQISDGVILWIRRDDQPTVSHVNLRRVRDAARRAGSSHLGSLSADTLAVGGLPQLLQGLERNFDFGPATPDTLANVPVWTVRGQWKRERLAELLPDKKAEILSGAPLESSWLPAHLPDRVTVMFGRDDFVPLFPYRIEYGRTDPVRTPGPPGKGRAGEGAETVRAIIVMELFEVRKEWDIHPHAFEYQLNSRDLDIKDDTEAYLIRLGLHKP